MPPAALPSRSVPAASPHPSPVRSHSALILSLQQHTPGQSGEVDVLRSALHLLDLVAAPAGEQVPPSPAAEPANGTKVGSGHGISRRLGIATGLGIGPLQAYQGAGHVGVHVCFKHDGQKL